MKGFLLGWFLAIFGTYHYGWEQPFKTGCIILFFYVLFSIILRDENDDALPKLNEGDKNEKG